MKPEAQTIAIAEACGWTKCRLAVLGVGAPERRPSPHGFPPGKNYEAPLPRYPYDLNVMHEAEESLYGAKRAEYMSLLTKIAYAGTNHATWFLARSTAAQRAEAFLRTILKWRDDE